MRLVSSGLNRTTAKSADSLLMPTVMKGYQGAAVQSPLEAPMLDPPISHILRKL